MEENVLGKIVDLLNEKFDKMGLFNNKITKGSKMFSGRYHTNGNGLEDWEIDFLGVPILGDEKSGDEDDAGYVEPVEKNERKIHMLAVSQAISMMDRIVCCLTGSDASQKNKKHWLEMLKKGIDDDGD